MPNAAPTTIAITAGDPLGIGPEVTVKALADGEIARAARVFLFGHEGTLAAACAKAGIAPMWSHNPVPPGQAGVQLVHRALTVPAGMEPGPTGAGGRHSYELLLLAIEACKLEPGDPRAASAIVTAPIAKEAWHAGGIHMPGHTEVLAREFESPESAMLFVGPTLRVILVTTHIPLAKVPGALTSAKIMSAIRLGNRACQELGVRSPRVAVAGLNPHAGESGVLGEEDARVIAPAVAAARAAGIDATGPLPGDTVFLSAVKGRFDLVVAMYHDQGLIPVKLLDRAKAVNVTVGLSWRGRRIVRTSPAHGTAFDIAGKNLADAASMVEAIRLARGMV